MRSAASREALRRISGIESRTVREQDPVGQGPESEIGFLHEIGSRFAAADPLQTVLNRVVNFVSSVVQCDSCFIYVLEEDALVLRASKKPHNDVVDRLKLRVGERHHRLGG